MRSRVTVRIGLLVVVLAATATVAAGCDDYPVDACSQEGSSSLSPDGRTLVISRPDPHWNHLFAVDLRTGSQHQLTDGRCDELPAWSPDARQIAFIHQDSEIVMIDRRGVRRTTLKGSFLASNDIQWLADERTLLYGIEDLDGPIGGVDYYLGVLPAIGGKASHPFHDARFPALAPDDSRIAYVSTSTNDLYVAPYPDTKATPHPLLRREGMSRLTWSPDGRWIAFHDRDGIEIVRPDGSGPRLLVADSSADFPTWLRDSRGLYYGASGAIWRVGVDSGAIRRVAAVGPD